MPMRTEQTVDRLRSDIDGGRTVDKIPARDAAAAPLGCDEEAAGTPVSSEAFAASRREERHSPQPPPRERGLGHAWVLVGFIVVFALAAVGWVLASV